MIKNGKYAYYKGNEYKFSRDADGNYIIITSDLKKTDCTFKQKLVDCLEKCLICRHIRRFAD